MGVVEGGVGLWADAPARRVQLAAERWGRRVMMVVEVVAVSRHRTLYAAASVAVTVAMGVATLLVGLKQNSLTFVHFSVFLFYFILTDQPERYSFLRR